MATKRKSERAQLNDSVQPNARARKRPKQKQLRTVNAQAAFLRDFAIGGIVTRAAHAAGVSRATVKLWRDGDPEFESLYQEAIEDSMDRLEQEARRRAEVGVEEPVFQKGMEVGRITRYSDVLMCLLLKGRRPEVFKDRIDLDGKIRTGLIDPKSSSDEELDARLAQALAERQARKAKGR